jgi:ribosomal protein S27AE
LIFGKSSGCLEYIIKLQPAASQPANQSLYSKLRTKLRLKGVEVNSNRRCPDCGEGTLRTWDELSDEEREVVKRLPASADYQAAERQGMHQWCTRCWHESVTDETVA